MPASSAPQYISSLRVQLLDRLVRYFPRKYFRFLRHSVEDKYFSHPLLLGKPLQACTPPPLPESYRFDVLDEAMLEQMMTHREALPAAVYEKRLALGDKCFCLSVNGELVSFQWLSTSHCAIFRGFDKGVDFMALEPHQAYSYDFYTYRDKRKLGYGSVVKQQLLAYLAAKQFSELLSCVMYHNAESLNIHLKLNYSLKGLPCNYRLMDWQWTVWGNAKEEAEARLWLEQLTRTLSTRNQQA